ncbi:MAG TPA: carboxypeptidase-like regulatory domain-containing protein [Chitinophagaceae bacterium]|nr:carboxypeptidase-like regulatory domain-containing protein [Chitinophagaceae bacterium]
MKLKILLLTVAGITGCLQSNASDPEEIEFPKEINELSGSIVDLESKKPLKDVSVTAYLSSKKEKQVLTDEFGRFGFDEMKSGQYRIVFEKEGYKKVVKEKVNIKADEPFQFKIEMSVASDFDLMPSQFHFIDFN